MFDSSADAVRSGHVVLAVLEVMSHHGHDLFNWQSARLRSHRRHRQREPHVLEERGIGTGQPLPIEDGLVARGHERRERDERFDRVGRARSPEGTADRPGLLHPI